MATYIERREGRSLSVDAHGQRVGRRTFFVDVPDPAAAVAVVVTAEGGINSPFPGDNGLIVDSIQHTPSDAGVGSEISYNYSSDRRFTMSQRVDKDKDGYYTWSSSWSTATVKVPAARKVTKVIGDGDTAVSVEVWENLESESLPQPRQSVSVNVTLTSWGPDDTGIIDAQTGVLHKINGAGGSQYLFEGASVSRRSDGLYDVTYNYVGDTITYRANNSRGDFVRPDFDRPPWHDYIMIPSSDPTVSPPTFALQFRMLPQDDNGHHMLPGWPL